MLSSDWVWYIHAAYTTHSLCIEEEQRRAEKERLQIKEEKKEEQRQTEAEREYAEKFSFGWSFSGIFRAGERATVTEVSLKTDNSARSVERLRKENEMLKKSFRRVDLVSPRSKEMMRWWSSILVCWRGVCSFTFSAFCHLFAPFR